MALSYVCRNTPLSAPICALTAKLHTVIAVVPEFHKHNTILEILFTKIAQTVAELVAWYVWYLSINLHQGWHPKSQILSKRNARKLSDINACASDGVSVQWTRICIIYWEFQGQNLFVSSQMRYDFITDIKLLSERIRLKLWSTVERHGGSSVFD